MGIKGIKTAEYVTVTCPCGKEFEVLVSKVAKGRGKRCSKECTRLYAVRPSGLTYVKHKDNPTSFKPGERPSPNTEFKPGEGHVLWKGGKRTEDIPGYDYLHKRVKDTRGAASTHECARADNSCKGLMNWANISHEYLGIEDFMPLCQSHHYRYDLTEG